MLILIVNAFDVDMMMAIDDVELLIVHDDN